MTVVELHTLKQRSDNYAYVLRCRDTNACTVIDASEPSEVLALVDRLGGHLAFILNTHHHHDHTDANLALAEETGAPVLAAEKDADRTPGLTIGLRDGDPVILGCVRGQVLETPGHTRCDLCFWFSTDSLLFTGDTLFSMGCGRLFEGTAQEMWDSMTRLRALPEDTQVFGGHEYTLANIAFARTIDPRNTTLLDWENTVRTMFGNGARLVTSTMGVERRANPFLRADDPVIQQALNMTGASPVEVFAELRRRKDHFTH